MAREITIDFTRLTAFINDYNLESLTANASFIDNLSQQHKKYFSYLTIVAELYREKPKDFNDSQFEYLLESSSDVGNALFSMINGSYKTANLVLRSSIENFFKAIFFQVTPGISANKSMYEIIDNIKQTDTYNDVNLKDLFDQIFSCYKQLCKDVHTATTANMEHLTALRYFPAYDEYKANTFRKNLVLLTSLYITIFSIINRHFVVRIHHVNKAIILAGIIKKYRPIVHGLE